MLKTEKIPRITISIGDFNGIGPEIILKSIAKSSDRKATPVIVAPNKVIEETKVLLRSSLQFNVVDHADDIQDRMVNILDLPNDKLMSTPGKFSIDSGKIAMQSIEKCLELCLQGVAHAMVTAPISKEAVNLAGYKIPGHTEFLAERTNTDEVLMMLVSGDLRVSLATTHIPIHAVAENISADLIERKVNILANSLRSDFNIGYPKIAVFGLNPHAGDGGFIGKEEIKIIEPTLERLNKKLSDVTIKGPFPADGFFGQKLHQKFDAILAMYHDQGLAPFKLLSFGKGVNFTAGLPIIRTSPDHGTAFDIAGKGVANPSSFAQAYDLAIELAQKRIREN